MSNTPPSNVIPMRDFDRSSPDPQAAQFERLLKECQNLALERLSSSVCAMLDKVETALWGLADQSHDRELRDLIISAKDKAIAQRKAIEQQFRDNYLAEFENRTQRERKLEEFSTFDLTSLELGLVNDEDLEETLRVNDMAAKLRRYCEEELNALDQRVGVLIGDANLQGDGNPFSPQAVCNAYKQTCRQLDSNIKIRMIFHKLFDDHVLDDVRSIYKDLNELLIERSILPKIRYGVRRTAAGIVPRPGIPGAGDVNSVVPGADMQAYPPTVGIPTAGFPGVAMPGFAVMGAGMPAGAGTAGGAGAAHGDSAAGGEQDFFAVLQALLAMNAQGSRLVSGAPFGGGTLAGQAADADGGTGVVPGGHGMLPAGGMVQIPGYPSFMGAPEGGVPGGMTAGGMTVPAHLLHGPELIRSLTRLQHGDIGGLPGNSSSLDAAAFASGTTNVVRELQASGFGSNVDQTDSITMDIVAMLFDQIFGDKRVPSALKALIGRLQIPVVKVAVLDKKFFSKKSHPARRMLDTLGEFALGLDEGFDDTSPLYQKLEEIVQRLLEEFGDNLDVFEMLQEELLAVIHEDSLRAEEAAKEVARKIAYTERLEVGKAMAQLEIRKRAESARMPQLVQRFLADHWLKLLLLAHARHGDDSGAWKGGLETMDLLIWSAKSKQTIQERRKLAHLLPSLLKRLHTGLVEVGTHSAVRDQFFSKLIRLHTKVIRGNAPSSAIPAAGAVPTLTEAVSPVAAATPPSGATHGKAPHPSVNVPAQLSASTAPALPAIDFDLGLEHKPDERNATASATATAHQVAQPTSTLPSRPTVEASVPAEIDEDSELAGALPAFSNITIKNPFGDGEIEVEEINMSDLPGGLGLAGSGGASALDASDQYSDSVTRLKAGAWFEFRHDDERPVQAKLSFISPLKGTYLFVNRHGARIGEYSLHGLARELRTGRAVLLETVPLIDRAMSSLVGAMKKNVRDS